MISAGGDNASRCHSGFGSDMPTSELVGASLALLCSHKALRAL